MKKTRITSVVIILAIFNITVLLSIVVLANKYFDNHVAEQQLILDGMEIHTDNKNFILTIVVDYSVSARMNKKKSKELVRAEIERATQEVVQDFTGVQLFQKKTVVADRIKNRIETKLVLSGIEVSGVYLINVN